jgi:2,3-bisphosphoglycerate-independent phosphoglycerate mutase
MKITMDRYGAEWAMVQRGWAIHVRGEGRKYPSCRAAIESLRAENPGVIDQNLPGFLIGQADGSPVGPIQDGAAVILFNFRGDRAIELTRAFDDEKFSEFDRGHRPDVLYAGMMQYDGDLLLPKRYLVSPPEIEGTVSEFLAKNGVTQYASSETQKFGHVTYFWNGNRSGKFDDKLETYLEVKSDVKPFEERPWMKAAEITDALIDALKSGTFKHLRVNYANGDMVGHTGIFESAVAAVNAVDIQLGRLLPVVAALEGALVVTADHGNADEMFEWDKKKKAIAVDKNGKKAPKTSHTLNPVPFYVHAAGLPLAIDASVARPGLGNVAATLLTLMGYQAPDGYMPSLLK